MRIEYTRVAMADVVEIERWWSEQRSRAPTLFIDELEELHERLEAHPRSGLRYQPVPDGFRVLLPRTRYHVYFRVLDDVVEVFAVVGAATATRPRR